MAFDPNPTGHLCLTFDFDGPSLWMQRRQTTPAPISRGEFGAVAVPRILRLLDRRDIKATFFIPGHTMETYPAECRAIAAAGHEIGLHGYAHELNATLDRDREAWTLTTSITLIEELTGQLPSGYRAPSGDVTTQTLDLLVEHGLRYDSSLMGHDYRPYQVRGASTFPDDGPPRWGLDLDLIELPWSWTLDDYVYLEFVTFRRMLMPGLRSPTEMFANFSGDVRWMTREVTSGVCTVVFHPQAIGRGHRLLALEAWIDEMSELGISFNRLDEIAGAVAAGTGFGIEDSLESS
ncbi:MAG: polysaccharide deacetylase [Actinomycetia bacterium]|nr:polysaccharide deacetylase [Actinomycetes bacterium]MCP4227921.1 polysaccharide deacetylase [Actinomycetes bacterium]MCP5030769.1 polysaccharide deacetylase [Actinomycetes bacterium]